MHVSADLLWAFYQRQLDSDAFVQSLEHSIEDCPECMEAVSEFRTRCSALDYTDVVHSATQRLLCRQTRIHSQRQLAEQWHRQLEPLPLERQVQLVAARQDGAFRGPAFAHVMLDAAREAIPGKPHLAGHYASLAEQALDPCCDDQELIALTLAHKANASRAVGDLPAAEALFQRVQQLAWRPADLNVAAEISGFLGSLRRDQRRFDEAIRHLRRAIRLFRVLGDSTLAAAHMLVLGYTHYFLDDCESAIAITHGALEQLDPHHQERLYLCARHNLTLYHCGAGRYREAEQDLLQDMPMYSRHLESWPQLALVVDWLAGRIALGLGRQQEAEDLLKTAQRLGEQTGFTYDAAMVCLDLALLYAQEGRLDDLHTITAQTLPLLRSFDLHREARAALNFFEIAVRRQAATAAILAKLNLHLLHARARCIGTRAKPS